ncbi:MAG TPA: ABC transporter ATP-binding protein [Capsulimonadaceae bacterium]|nr:ABC transporter ATP-binding protein [Capsulimonadaceae bacterium]
MSLLRTDAVSLAYFDGDRTTYALKEASIEIPDKEFVGVMGPSGSGKSSLLYILSGLKHPTSGDVYLRDQRVNALSDSERTALRRRSFGFVFQQPWLLSWQTALENVLMGAPQLGRGAQECAERYFSELGIHGIEKKMPSQLSGGEKQRVCVARAMMNDPAVIFADEPTASLDHKNGHLVVDLLSAYRERGTVIIVTHDAEMLPNADRVLIMRDGQAVEWISPKEARAGTPFAISTPD